MKAPSYADSFEVLVLQAADEGRGPVLFGDSLARARRELRPFMVGEKFPNVYLEFPLIGNPFLDVTVLYSDLKIGTRVESAAAEGAEPMLDWFASICSDYPQTCCGFEIDVKDASLPRAAVHFQPRNQTHLVIPFCKAIGEEQAASLYLSQNERMPEGWDLSFFGMFRGRPGSPLRVCGYLAEDEKQACARDTKRLAAAFDTIGYTAYTDTTLKQASTLLATAPSGVDFQFDIAPDGTLGPIFAIDAQFGIEQPEAVIASFTDGPASSVMRLLEQWGIADSRWHLGAQAAFARSLPVEMDDGRIDRFAFTLMPQWVKARWNAGVLQPSKLYYLGSAGVLERKEEKSF